MSPLIAIDGPSGAGKGLLARNLGQSLGFAVLDTGLVYRSFALFVLTQGVDPRNQESVVSRLLAFSMAHIDLSDPILREESTALTASIISRYPEVRDHLTAMQREFAYHPPSPYKGAILDGRDIGTIIVPEAPLKLYVTADLKIRAQRRWKELHQKGHMCKVDDVLKELEERDTRDQERAIAPLAKAPDAILIDTSYLTPDEVLRDVLALVQASRT